MATTQFSSEVLVLSETSDKVSTSPAVEESRVLDETEENGTTLQPEFEYVAGWRLHFITIGYLSSRPYVPDVLSG